MAKSLRSKRKRKIRAEKRIVNAKKELVRLRGTTDGPQISKESIELASIPDVSISEAPMLLDGADSNNPSNNSNKKSLTRINNQWMNQRKMKAIKGKIKRHNKKKARRGSSAGLSSRKAKKSLRK